MIDIHCHILPETDDGAATWEVAEKMCRMALADGITHVVATPHANHKYSYDRSRHAETLDRLRAVADGDLQFTLGCDFHFSFDNLVDAYDHPDRYTIAGTDYLLIELSDFSIAPGLVSKISELNVRGFRPILTHPERNAILRSKSQLIPDLLAAGCAMQVTANALTGRWGKAALKFARWMLDNNAVHFIASDGHDAESRPPVLSQARDLVAKWCGDEVAQALVEDNPRAVIENRELPYFVV